jgi:hypothetical protein
MFEELQTAWEVKRDDRRFFVYQTAINNSLANFKKILFMVRQKACLCPRSWYVFL